MDDTKNILPCWMTPFLCSHFQEGDPKFPYIPCELTKLAEYEGNDWCHEYWDSVKKEMERRRKTKRWSTKQWMDSLTSETLEQIKNQVSSLQEEDR